MPANPNVAYGRALLDSIAGQIPVFGNVHAVVSTSDSADPNYMNLANVIKTDTDGRVRLWTSIEDALAYGVVSNNNDVVALDGHSTHNLTAGIALTMNRVNFIGMDGGGRMLQQGAKVQLGGAIATAYVLKNTGVRNSFRNIKFIQASTAGTALTVLQEGGEGGLYENCSFVFGVVNNLGGTTAHEVVAGCDSTTFKECTFGADTLLTSGARSVFHVDQVNGFEFKSNQIIDCTFSISSSSATATFVRLDAVGDILFSNLFKRCTFLASVDSAGGIALAEASQTGTSTVKGCLAYDQCAAFNCTDFSTATSGRNAATQILAATATAGTAGVGVQPTA